ncbi:MAG: energy-coupling factor transport system ATP-binding protein [Thermosediminibacterales bacterium]|nr:energy-coupling factor transport system ATP-binding protein [Thermosediminibacterales bacterium]
MPIIIENLSHVYMPGTPFESKAIDNINLTIEDGEVFGLIGHTGSGKSTLIQHFNGLLRPTTGRVVVNGIDITNKNVDLKKLRSKVGLIFQYPEHQLFEETVVKDVAFGPKNLGLSQEEIQKRVKEALALVGLDYDVLKDRSPFELSGGQMRRIAIAGVLAMKPEVLILDEPTAGLDPRGRDEILEQIKNLHMKHKITVILVSHNMEDIARMAGRVGVMYRGKLIKTGTPRQVFSDYDTLKKAGLGIPQVTKLMKMLKEQGKAVRTDVLTVKEAENEILSMLRGKKHA